MDKRTLALIGLGLLTLGLLLGLIPGSADGYAGKSFACGSPWVRDGAGVRSQESRDELGDVMTGFQPKSADYQRRCDDALSTRGVFAWIATGLGIASLIGAATVPAGSAAKPGEDQAVGAEPDKSDH